MAWFAGLLLCLLVVLTCIDVFARATRLLSLPWSLDVAEYSLYLVAFLGAPWVLREQGHIAIELFVERLGPTAKARVARMADLAGLLVCAVLFFYACRQLARSFASGTLVHETFVYPEWYPYLVPPPVFLILLMLFVRRLRAPIAG